MTLTFAGPMLAFTIGAALMGQPLSAQPQSTQDKIKVREVPAPVAVSTDSLGVRLSVRALSDGRVLVNDVQRYRVLMYDKSLKHFTRRSTHPEPAEHSAAPASAFHRRILSRCRPTPPCISILPRDRY
ncbi:MAG: hypothetical protein IPP90_15010 [Gemmatimonadaceae bacterium]|nr:hypothetical protein [Gemmatimonadaceae bacterium]